MYRVEIEIIDCIPLNERKDLRKKPGEKRKRRKSQRQSERGNRKETTRTGRCVTAFSQRAQPSH